MLFLFKKQQSFQAIISKWALLIQKEIIHLFQKGAPVHSQGHQLLKVCLNLPNWQSVKSIQITHRY
jgi:hypothetical protein